MRSYIFVMLFLSPLCARAGGLFSPFINNLMSGGHFCPAISKSDVSKLQAKLGLNSYHKSEQALGPVQLKELLYAASVEHFEKKTRCVSDYADKIVKNKNALEEIRKSLAVIWLNRRKSQLILNECKKLEKLNVEASINRVGSSWGARPDFHSNKYTSICMDPKIVLALQGLVSLSERAIPFLSSREFINLMERNRHLILLEATGKPLTDKELIDLNLTSNSRLFKFDKTQKADFHGKIVDYILKKVSNNEDYLKTLSQDHLHFAKLEDDLQTLYDEGSVKEVLELKGVTPLKIEKDRDLSRMYYCLSADYERSFIGEIMDFVALFMVGGEFIKGIQVISKLGPFYANTAASVIASMPALGRQCFQKKKLDSFSGLAKNHILPLSKDYLPQGLDMDLYRLESVPVKEVESCREMSYDSLYLSRSTDLGCWEEGLLAVLPGSLGMSFSLLMISE